uniref:DNA-directed RNA polymerase n=1 Tax=Babesia sp. Dunhuang TaxID=1164853 RepID=A0A411ADE2_9APIC|nr:RpoC2b [Babesia sp. Xinjiang]QAX26991.1 RpoC2b [Babesia sp. Xinjiang]QAX27022.1 RpoC2b [Babesia sp. Dunhuang]
MNKNIILLSIVHLSYIEKYLKELINLCFEYSYVYPFAYNLNNFKSIPIYNSNININNISNLFYLLNLYLEKDPFTSPLYTIVNLKSKLTLNQLFQILIIKGMSKITGHDVFLLNNLYYGLSLKDVIYSSFAARNSIIDSSLNTSESGYLTRKLVESLRGVFIKNNICKTLYTCIRYNTKKLINIPFICLNNKSVCLKCINVKYNILSLSGHSKGVISGQALGEPSTQMLLRTFHLGDRTSLKSSMIGGRNKKTHSKLVLMYIKFNENNSSKPIITNKKNIFKNKYLYKINFIYNIYIQANINIYLTLYKLLRNLWSIININYDKYLYKNKTYKYTDSTKYFILY